jgi:ketosteroid isomerase-like protein
MVPNPKDCKLWQTLLGEAVAVDGPVRRNFARLEAGWSPAPAGAFVGLAPTVDGTSFGATLSKDVVRMLHKTSVDWQTPTEPMAVPA